ncbi:hypothetical protein LSTR_LSTR012195 [Laodelphax striatellus]|uniref:eRF1/Pelota-like N-terminal domain-containing protein n=1 Tax=Laodelphax striatellus TaxID=195883 RepID=A0A482WY20_LAOST|nr:hypothetical protein LSTR_LSTR012195 [Laodelphax striatellus]
MKKKTKNEKKKKKKKKKKEKEEKIKEKEKKVQTESATGSSTSNRVRTVLKIAVENIDFDTQACVLRLKGRNVEENQYVKVSNYFDRYKDHTRPYYLGDISCFWFTYYNTAEAGYVLSMGAIQMLLSIFNSTEACLAGGKHWRNEDYHLGRHLYGLGVRPEDTRDKVGRGRFHTFTPEQLYLPDDVGLLERYFRRRIHPNKQGPSCCNKRSITFRASCQDRIFFYYYMLYKIRTHVAPDFYPNNLSNSYIDTPQEFC